ncbi:MAG: DNA alkylation repair protein [Propioniciclava sp.]
MGALITAIRDALAAGANPERAAGQQRYMKSAMPFRGLTAPELTLALHPILAAERLPDAPTWRSTAQTLWDEAGYREERYAAIAVLRHRSYREWARDPQPELVTLLRHLIVTGAWWDLVDVLASHCVGNLLRARPDVMTPLLRQWAVDPDLWLRRTAILSQLSSKQTTDTALLRDAIAGSTDDPDFFARKAIGWALREFSKTDADWVRRYLTQHPELSPLSQREARRSL